jgi:hypothetical protein
MVSLPLAWLLSYAALLPFYLGLFFFALFGLIIGAVMHRIASAGRPYRRVTLIVGTAIVVAFTWVCSIAKEARDFPNDMACSAAGVTRYIGDRPIGEWRAEVADKVRRFLREHYPPGGALGYVRWVLVSGELKRGQIEGVDRTLRRSQRGYSWAIRAVLSLALLGFGVSSQTLPMRRATDHSVGAIDEERAVALRQNSA